MSKSKCTILVVMAVWAAVPAAGCGVFDLSNGLQKLANGQIGALTSNEIIAVVGAGLSVYNQQNGTNLMPPTPEQADALVKFLDCAMIENSTQLQDIQNNPQGIPQDCLNALAQAFQGTNQQFDPNAVSQQELKNLFPGL